MNGKNVFKQQMLLLQPLQLSILRQYPNVLKVDNYRYRSVLRGHFLESRGLRNKIDSHHIIPKQFKRHEMVLSIDFDINRSYNLMYLPNHNFGSDTELPMYVHSGGHRRYNQYVLTHLNDVNQITDPDEKKYYFWLLLKHLEKGVLDKSVPWN